MRVGKMWRRLRQLSGKQFLLLGEASFYLALSRLSVRTVPFRRVARRLGRRMAESPFSDAPGDGPVLTEVGWAVKAAGGRLPWRCRCLEQAIAAKWMLRRRDIPATLYLGVKGQGNEMAAHSWTRCGSRIVTGANVRLEDFTKLASFAD